MLLLVAIQFLDFLTFSIGIGLGMPISFESNPLIMFSYQNGGFITVALFKIIGLLILFIVLNKVAEKNRNLALGVCIAVSLIPVLFNTIAIISWI